MVNNNTGGNNCNIANAAAMLPHLSENDWAAVYEIGIKIYKTWPWIIDKIQFRPG